MAHFFDLRTSARTDFFNVNVCGTIKAALWNIGGPPLFVSSDDGAIAAVSTNVRYGSSARWAMYSRRPCKQPIVGLSKWHRRVEGRTRPRRVTLRSYYCRGVSDVFTTPPTSHEQHVSNPARKYGLFALL